jgi:hypothetical protein
VVITSRYGLYEPYLGSKEKAHGNVKLAESEWSGRIIRKVKVSKKDEVTQQKFS